MKSPFVLHSAVGLLIVAGLVGCQQAGEDKKAASDEQKMAGTWTMVSGESDGAPLPENDVKASKLTITGDAYTVDLGSLGVKKGTQKLDSTKAPKQIDAQDASGPTVGKNLGIYEFTANGDFRVCFGGPGKERPTEFASKPGSGTFIHVWRKAK